MKKKKKKNSSRGHAIPVKQKCLVVHGRPEGQADGWTERV